MSAAPIPINHLVFLDYHPTDVDAIVSPRPKRNCRPGRWRPEDNRTWHVRHRAILEIVSVVCGEDSAGDPCACRYSIPTTTVFAISPKFETELVPFPSNHVEFLLDTARGVSTIIV